MDISAIVLNKILESKDLDGFSRVKLCYLDPSYASVFTAINRYYSKYSTVPGFKDIELTLREGSTSNTLEAIKLTESVEVELDVAIDALIDQYTQNEFLKLISNLVDKVTTLDSEEIKDSLSNIVTTLDEKTHSSDTLCVMDEFLMFLSEEEVSANRVMLGFNNSMDAILGGAARQEYILIGGERGSGKSLVVANIAVNQYLMGNTVPFFTIEMTARETLERMLSMLSGVNYQNIKLNKMSADELLKVVKVRADMFIDADDLVEEFKVHRDKFLFESTLLKTKELKPDNQIVLVDDRNLNISKIDIHLGKLKAKFGDKIAVCVVDYINQIKLEGTGQLFGQFDWKPQVEVSTQLKNLARKHDVVMISPYQVDKTGEARFAKGILDAADISFVMEVYDKETGVLGMRSTKMRSSPEQVFNSGISWDILRVCPVDAEPPQKKEKAAPEEGEPKKKSKKATKEPVKDDSGDMPWD